MELSATSLGVSGATSIAKYNPHHDAKGRFSSGSGGGVNGTGHSPEAHAAAQMLYKRAIEVEPSITSVMVNAAEKHGARLEGLPFRIKQPDSLARKIHGDAIQAHVAPAVAAKGISDSVRYTMIAGEADYTKVTNEVLADFKAKGYTARAKNYWQEGDPYQGINVAMTSPTGVGVELQFHTAESFRVKEKVNHPLYMEYRVSTDDVRRKAIWDEMVGNAASVPFPPDAVSIPTLKMQEFQLAPQYA